jgi:hypothetical protein
MTVNSGATHHHTLSAWRARDWAQCQPAEHCVVPCREGNHGALAHRQSRISCDPWLELRSAPHTVGLVRLAALLRCCSSAPSNKNNSFADRSAGSRFRSSLSDLGDVKSWYERLPILAPSRTCSGHLTCLSGSIGQWDQHKRCSVHRSAQIAFLLKHLSDGVWSRAEWPLYDVFGRMRVKGLL